MREVERMHGRGFVTEETGERFPVTYVLKTVQDEIYVGAGEPSLAGLKDVIGRVLPVARFDGIKTLEMSDGRKLKFFYRSSDGWIA